MGRALERTANPAAPPAQVEVFRAAIEELPANDNPELFGLHSNADLTFRRLQTRGLAVPCQCWQVRVPCPHTLRQQAPAPCWLHQP